MSAHSLTDDQVVHLYLSGFMSGVASFLTTSCRSTHPALIDANRIKDDDQ